MTYQSKDPGNTSSMVHDTFRMYMESYREFLRSADGCTNKMSPDQKRMLQDAFRLQRLLKERQARRFEHWLRGGTPDIETLKSLSSISERLDRGWSDAEEDVLKANSSYTEILREIEELQSVLDSALLTEPLQALEGDSQYREARLALAERVKEFEKRMNP